MGKKCKNTECENVIPENRVYCSLKCRNVYVNKHIRDHKKNAEGLSKKAKQKYKDNPKFCKHCDKKIPYSKRENTFCNASCSASYTNKKRKGIKRKTRALKNIKSANIKLAETKSKYFKEEYEKNPKKCIICGNKIVYKKRENKTCSNKCKNILLRKKSIAHPNCGGKTFYKRYEYNGINFDSSWEVKIAKWLDKNNIKWIRKGLLFWWSDKGGQRRRYHPDFYLPEYDVYLDPKNPYKLKNDLPKLKKVIEEHKITLHYGSIEKIKKEVKKLL
jgi:predicted nucleic acid-binding Zn ribbon protein